MSYSQLRQKSNLWIIIAIAAVASLGGFILGFDAGVIVDGKDQISSQFFLSDFDWSLITSMSIVGTLITVPVSGRLVDYLGTKTMLVIVAIGFIIGLLLTAISHHLTQFVIGRFITGVSIGIASFSAPLFISEIAPPHIRGGMVLLNGIAITSGQTISFLIGYFLHDTSAQSWRFIVWIEMLPAICLLFGMFFMPKSPRWVAMKYGIPQARAILKKIRGGNSEALLEKEINEIQLNVMHSSSGSQFSNLFSKKLAPVLIAGVGLALLQQFSGISAVMYYGPVIFEAAGFHSVKNAIFATFSMGFVNLIFTIVSAFLIDYFGRRVLLLCGILIAAISLFQLGISCMFFHKKWLILFFMATYIIGYCISVGSLFWVLVSEIYPAHIRGFAMSFTTSVQCSANFIVTITFLQLLHVLGEVGDFWLYGTACFIGFIFIYYCIPETKGLSLELIEANLTAGKRIRMLGQ